MRPPTEFVTNVRPKGETIEEYRQRYLDSVPFKFQQHSCSCRVSVDNWHKTAATSPNGLIWNWEGNVPRHWDCGKVPGIWTYLEECFSCGDLYLVKTYPDTMMICEGCGG